MTTEEIRRNLILEHRLDEKGMPISSYFTLLAACGELPISIEVRNHAVFINQIRMTMREWQHLSDLVNLEIQNHREYGRL